MGTAVMGDWCTSVQLTQLDHEIGVKEEQQWCQRVPAEMECLAE